MDELSMQNIRQRIDNIDPFKKELKELMQDGEGKPFIQKPVLQKEGNRAMISINGPMMLNPGLFERVMFDAVSTQDLMAAVQDVAQDSKIDQVLFDINSPGGEASKIDVLADQVNALSKVKQTAALNNGMMASAAYYVGSQAGKVFSTHKFNETGSIGTVTALVDSSKAFENEGHKVYKIATGELKGAGMYGTEISQSFINSVQSKVDALQADFSIAVERSRPDADMADGSEARSGQSFFQADAERLGLSDGIKTIQEAFDYLNQGSRAARLRKTI